MPLWSGIFCSDSNQDNVAKQTGIKKYTEGVIVYYHPKMRPSRCRETSLRLSVIQRYGELH